MSGMNQGKDPPLNLIHKSRADANAYIGRPGQMTLLGDYTDGNTPRLIEARFHNGLFPGGFVMPLTPAPQGNDPETGPAPRVMVEGPQAFGAAPFTLRHNFGYFPTVTIVDNAGAPVTPQAIQHLSLDEVQVDLTAAGTYTIILR